MAGASTGGYGDGDLRLTGEAGGWEGRTRNTPASLATGMCLTAENPKEAAGRQKPQLHLIPPVASILEAEVLALGAKKYVAYNWRGAGINVSTYISAMLRHIAAYADGEDADPESGVSHIAHVRACTAIMLDAISLNNANDDRPQKEIGRAHV